MGTVCIVCKQEKKGASVNDDIILNLMRRIKQTLRIAKNNKLVVCKNCMETHREKREKFEKTLVRYGALGGIIAIILILLARNLPALLSGLFVIAMMVVFALFFYWPSLAEQPGVQGADKIVRRQKK